MPNFDPSQPLPGEDELAPTPVGAALVGALTDGRSTVLPGTNPLLAKNLTDPVTGLPPNAADVPVPVPTVAPAPAPVPEPLPVAPAPVVHGGSAGGYGVTNQDAAITAAGAAKDAAITDESKALAATDTAEAQARHEGAQQVQEQQQQLAQQRVARDAALRQLNQDSSDALEKAHKTTVPDFWEGKPGQAVTAAIMVGLGAVGQGLTAFGTGNNLGNGAQTIINHAVDSYAEKKRDEVNNLYKYAAAKNQLSQEQKLEWATKLNEVQFDLAATHQSIQDHLQEVAAQGRGKIDQAHYAMLSAENQQHTQQLLQAAQMNRAQINHMRNEDANAAARIGIERTKANGEASEKADEAAFRTYVQAPHGKEAQTLGLRLSNMKSALEDIKNGKSAGEVTKALEAVIAADTGQGTRGVSQGQLHTIIPNLVSKSGEISNAVAQGWNGKAGQEYRNAVLRLAQSAYGNRVAEYNQKGADLEKSVAMTPHGQNNKDFARTARAQLYPELPAEPTALPPGAIPGTFNGKKGYALNGQFVAQ